MEYIEVSARTVDDAITEALIKLGATSDQIEYEVIEKGSTGFLGIARKDAVIKVRKKYSLLLWILKWRSLLKKQKTVILTT